MGWYCTECCIYSEQSVLFFGDQGIFVGLVFLIMSEETFIIHDPLFINGQFITTPFSLSSQFLQGPTTRYTLAKPCLK